MPGMAQLPPPCSMLMTKDYISTSTEKSIYSSQQRLVLLFMLLIIILPDYCSSYEKKYTTPDYSDALRFAPPSRVQLERAVDNCVRNFVSNKEPMRAVIREMGGMEFHAKVREKYYPRTPKKGTDEVMVSVRAASINPDDYKAGVWPIVGLDVSGVIIEVAEDSTSPFKVGDEVFGVTKGSLADRVCTSSATLGRKPSSLSFVQAAAMPTSYLTSLQALRDYGKLPPNGRVMVIGASGGCGIAGLQIAQYMGASDITAVTSTKNRELVLQEGATGFIDYTVADIAERCGPQVSDDLRFDVVYDCASGSGEGENYRPSAVTCLREPNEREGRPHGQYVATNGIVTMWVRMYTIGQRRNEHMFLNNPNTADLNLIAELTDGGVLNPVVMKTIPLTSQTELDEGFQILKSRRAVGKIVFTLSDDAEVDNIV